MYNFFEIYQKIHMRLIKITFLLSFITVISSISVPAFASNDSFSEKLNSLTEQELSYPYLTERGGSIQDETIAGIKLGDKMDDVVRLWGKPRLIWMRDNDIVQLTFFNSNFIFRNDQLISIGIHSVDLPNLVLKEGISFKSKITDLEKVFPSGKVETVVLDIQVFNVEISDRLNGRFQMGSDGKIIAITIERP
ncbi:hypothetical protein [Nostoc sp. TCL26-01]|uniref:hypothetical protein n=1 Tax=Nostoc sp. TCL26-01 TaxID=2576904 RepID=UPI0015C16BAA|nr:hypothetical protein [Nostoc sp. TCL26-01]QLE56491.1 hypothetical protein FD725_13780 [Nostoc sp. TCL26-01]